ncbi:hypothetical protein [Schlesneria sp. DSM 10557]|uniref:hypothetical protein n=1 Tax=Schlesneria sp. DSM 10557 TaxID=3044399 RepID=UPI0035A1BD0E
MSENQSVSGGMSFSSWLLLMLIGLKLTGFIHWSWLWVLSPIWIQVAFVAVIFTVGFVAGLMNRNFR